MATEYVTIEIPREVYERLERLAQKHGYESIVDYILVLVERDTAKRESTTPRTNRRIIDDYDHEETPE